MPVTTYLNITKLEVGQAQKEVTINEAFDAFDAARGPTFITGLELEWVSASSIKVKSGGAWCGGTAAPGVYWIADTTVSGISLGNNAWGHVYLHAGGGGPIEVISHASGPPEYVVAGTYKKTGNPTHRYLGSVRTDGSGNILNFSHNPVTNFIRYLSNFNAAPLLLASGLTATSETSIIASSATPVTSRLILTRAHNGTSNAAIVWFGVDGDSCAVPGAGVQALIPGAMAELLLPMSASQAFTYAYDAATATSGLFMGALGYYFQR